VLAAALLAVPIACRAVPSEGRTAWLGYFFGLGLAYIAVEVVLMQRFAFFLGHPTYAVTTVLFALLLFSGLGSAWAGSRREPRSLVRALVWLLPVAILLLAFAVPPFTRAMIRLPLGSRVAIAVACIAPLGFLMGMPFPIGIRTAAAAHPAFVAWAWAANGCASVIGSVCAVLGAMAWNFSVVLVVSGAVYVGGLALLLRRAPALAPVRAVAPAAAPVPS
jgi:hypothetical protein